MISRYLGRCNIGVRLSIIGIILIAGIIPQIARAEAVTVDLPLAGQTYQRWIRNLTVPVDLGAKFSTIESVRVELLGRVQMPPSQGPDWIEIPEECWLRVLLGGDAPGLHLNDLSFLYLPSVPATVDYGEITKWTAEFTTTATLPICWTAKAILRWRATISPIGSSTGRRVR